MRMEFYAMICLSQKSDNCKVKSLQKERKTNSQGFYSHPQAFAFFYDHFFMFLCKEHFEIVIYKNGAACIDWVIGRIHCYFLQN
jgi:hypothetical protein